MVDQTGLTKDDLDRLHYLLELERSNRVERVPRWLWWVTLLGSGIGLASIAYNRTKITDQLECFMQDLKRDTMLVFGLLPMQDVDVLVRMQDEIDELRMEVERLKMRLHQGKHDDAHFYNSPSSTE